MCILSCLMNESHHEKTCFLHMRNKGADQLCGERTADQRLFCYIDSAIPLLSKKGNDKPLAIFCDCTGGFVSMTWSETRKTGFLATRLK